MIIRDEKWLLGVLREYHSLFETAMYSDDINAIIELNEIEDASICTVMSDTQRRRLAMVVRGYSLDEMARIEGVSWQAVRSSIKKACKKVIANLEEREGV